LLAESWRPQGQRGNIYHDTTANWFGDSDLDLETWARLFRDSRHPEAPKHYYGISDLKKDYRTKALTSVAGPPFLKFFAAVPIFSRLKICVGSVIVLDTANRGELSAQETSFMNQMAEKCMTQLEMGRDVDERKRAMKLHEGLNSFITSQALTTQFLEEPRSLQRSRPDEQLQKRSSSGHIRSSSSVLKKKEAVHESASETLEHVNPALGPAAHDDVASQRYGASSITSERPQSVSGVDRAETSYRKTFRRAAEHLRTSLDVEGVIFVDGLVGFHGDLLPTAEPEQELEHELAQRPQRRLLPGEEEKNYEEENVASSKNDLEPEARIVESTSSQEEDSQAHRTFTSADYQKNILTKRPAEILGFSLAGKENYPRMEVLSESTKGLAQLDEGFLQIFMERHASGKIWYFDGKGRSFYFKDDCLVADGLNSDATQVATAFPGVRQMIFAPLTDLTTFKRLAGCFSWTTQSLPLFTDLVDLPPYKAFLHSVEAEISRLDTISALKQKESFVSSVSHELRTPLHGVLGALEFLEDTNLDTFQRSLTHTIRSCGSTLHQTLSSVLSYAKINEFERRSNKPLQTGPQESPWALHDKDEHTRTDKDFHGPFICTNLATLFEEIVEVTQSGRSFGGSANVDDLVLTLTIAYRENWDFVTEPGALRRILMNIIGNALKYSTKGFVSVSLEAEDLKKDEKGFGGPESRTKLIKFTVKDSGKGMSRDFIQNHLFVPFAQENAGASEGVGLGMSIVKSLVALLGAQINVKSQVGKGTEIEVTFPMQEGKPAAQEPPSRSILLEHIVSELRQRRLTVAFHELVPAVEQSLRYCLIDWFKATVLSEAEDLVHTKLHTDILIIDEDRTDIEAVRGLAQTFGQDVALLAVSTSQKKDPKSVASEGAFPVWETINQPIGPDKISRVLQRCVHALQSGSATAQRSLQAGTGKLCTAVEASGLHGEPKKIDDPDSAGAQAEALPIPTQHDAETAILPAGSNVKDPKISPDPAVKEISKPVSFAKSSPKRRQPSILLVEDNAINLKLLQTFVTKYGVEDIKTAENGLEAVDSVKKRVEGFDIIFMGESDTSPFYFTKVSTMPRAKPMYLHRTPSIRYAARYM
jgi:signal transduction histidine kinase